MFRPMCLSVILLASVFISVRSSAAAESEAAAVPDLTPVTSHPAPDHEPVDIVTDGRPVARIYVALSEPTDKTKRLVEEFVRAVRLSTGAELEVVQEMPAADRPAIIIGNCEESRRAGIDPAGIPVEGVVVKTAPHRVYLVGSIAPLPFSEKGIWGTYVNDGTAWAVADFLERFVGVRWYWPFEAHGRSVVETDTLAVPPVHYSDAPVFRLRDHHPPKSYKAPWRSRWFDKEHPEMPLPEETEVLNIAPMLAYLRSGNSWPYRIKVHEPQGVWRHKSEEWLKEHEDMFAVKKDGSPNYSMFCYSSEETLQYLLAGCERVWDEGGAASWVTESSVTVSPADAAVTCHGEECRELFEPEKAPFGSASRIMAEFVQKFAREVKRRWPEKKVLYLPYWNYTYYPEGYEFPDNLEIKACNAQGMAVMGRESARKPVDESLRSWSEAVGGGVTTWEYSIWITNWTHAPMQYPHVVRDYYRSKRDILAGSFINGGLVPEWSKTAPSLYVWMKVLWNPDVDVEAILDEMCRRMFGDASESTRELLKLMVQRWEEADWSERLGSAGRVSDPIFCDTWPPEVVAEMIRLRDRARGQIKGDPVATRRLDYWLWTFEAFVEEAKDRYEKEGVEHDLR